MLTLHRAAQVLIYCVWVCVSEAKPPVCAQQLLELWHKGNPGAAIVAWVDGDGVVFFRSGNLSVSDGRVATPDTCFEIGSVTKVFTGLLLADSVRRGEVALDDPVAGYLLPVGDALLPRLEKITFVSLATHSSGFPEQPANFTSFAAPREELVDGLRREGPAASPGNYEYSNFGVALIGDALASATGTTYAELLQRRICEPLGLTRTKVSDSSRAGSESLAPGHFREGTEAAEMEVGAYAAAGALTSSARDLSRFLQFCLSSTDHPLRSALLATMTPRRTGDNGDSVGLCWRVSNVRPLYWHDGATYGHQSYVGFDPSKGTALAILVGDKSEDVEFLAAALLDANLPNSFAPIANATDYTGRYSIKNGGWVDITECEGWVYGCAAGGARFVISRISEDKFSAVGAPLTVSFERNRKNAVVGLSLRQNDRDYRGKRGDIPPRPIERVLPAGTLADYAGTYSLDPTTSIVVTVSGGRIQAQITGQVRLTLYASDMDRFFSKMEDSQFEFRRGGAGRMTSVTIRQNGEDVVARRIER